MITPAPYVTRIRIDAPPVPPVKTIRVDIPRGFPMPPPIGDFARLSQPNVFLQNNVFPAISIVPRIITEDTVLTSTDGEIIIDCSVEDTDIVVTLPISNGTGHNIRVDRKDYTVHTAGVVTQGDDVMGASGITTLPMAPSQGVLFVAGTVNYWAATPLLPETVIPDNIAFLNVDNFFTGVNSFGGIRLGTRVISGSTSVQPSDYAIYIRGALADIDIQLPPAILSGGRGRGQPLRMKILDDAPYLVRINAFDTDLIDEAASATIYGKFAEANLFEADVGVWDLWGAGLVKALDPPPPAPANQREIVELLASYGLCSPA